MKRKTLLMFGFIMVLSLVLSACAGQMASESMSQGAPEAPAMDYDEAVSEEAEYSGRDFDSGTNVGDASAERMVIYNANVKIAVQDPVSAMEAVIEMAENSGGFVVYSNIYKSSTDRGEFPTASLTIRVPAGDLDSILAAIKKLTPNPSDDVIFENVSGQDVTSEYTDLSSRLRNLEAAEAQLVELMETAQDAEDVLAIFNELTYYRGEIEVVKGRMKYLEESVDLSAITVEIVAKESIQPVKVGEWEPKGTAARAVEALISAAKFVGDAVIWFGIFCLPFLIPLGIGIYFIVRIIRKRKAHKKADKVETISVTKQD